MSGIALRPRKRLAVYRTTSVVSQHGQPDWVSHAWWADLYWSTALCPSWQSAMDAVNRDISSAKRADA